MYRLGPIASAEIVVVSDFEPGPWHLSTSLHCDWENVGHQKMGVQSTCWVPFSHPNTKFSAENLSKTPTKQRSQPLECAWFQGFLP